MTGIKTEGEIRCPHCHQIMNERVMTLSKSMVKALARIYFHAKQIGKHEFDRKEIEQYLTTLTEKATFGDWIYFSGGIVYKPEGRGSWGINMERAAMFLKGSYRLPIRISKHKATSDVTVMEEGTIHDVKGIKSFLTEQGDFIARYV